MTDVTPLPAMIRVSHNRPIGHVIADPSRPDHATGYYGAVSRVFTGRSAADEAMVWVRDAELRKLADDLDAAIAARQATDPGALTDQINAYDRVRSAQTALRAAFNNPKMMKRQ